VKLIAKNGENKIYEEDLMEKENDCRENYIKDTLRELAKIETEKLPFRKL
jgi:hypothetical protein